MRHGDFLKAEPLVWGWTIFLTLIIVILHIHFLLHAGGLWRDETNLVNVANSGSLQGMSRDSFPILMPLLVHCWEQFGWRPSDIALRCLGASIGVATVASLWIAAWLMFRRPPLLGMILFGLNSTVIVFGDSLRGYGLGAVFAILTVASGWKLLNQPSLFRFSAFLIVCVLGVQSNYFNAVLVMAVCLGLSVAARLQTGWRPTILALLAGSGSALTLLPYVTAKLTELHHSPAQLHTGFQLRNLDKAPVIPLVWLLLIILVLVGSWRKFRSEPDSVQKQLAVFLGLTLVLSLLGSVAFCWWAKVSTARWYYVPVMGVAAVCFDGYWILWTKEHFTYAGLGFALAVMLIVLPDIHQDLRWRFTNVDLLAGEIIKKGSPNDYVIVSPWHDGISFDRYFPDTNRWDTLPPLAEHLTHNYDLFDEQMNNPGSLDPVLHRINRALQSGASVWFVSDDEAWSAGDRPSMDLVTHNSSKGELAAFYMRSIQSKIMDYLRENSLEFGKVAEPYFHGSINPLEHPNLFVASGWRGSLPATPVSK